jgi:hypothetical protein
MFIIIRAMPFPHSLSEVTLADVAVSLLVVGALALVIRTSKNIAQPKPEQELGGKRQRRRKKAKRVEDNAEEQPNTVTAARSEPSAGKPKRKGKAGDGGVSAHRAPGGYLVEEFELASKSTQAPREPLVDSVSPVIPPLPKQESKSKKSRNKKASLLPLDGKTLAERLQPSRPSTEVDDMIDREIEPERSTARVLRVVDPDKPDVLQYSDPEEGWNQVRRSSTLCPLC